MIQIQQIPYGVSGIKAVVTETPPVLLTKEEIPHIVFGWQHTDHLLEKAWGPEEAMEEAERLIATGREDDAEELLHIVLGID